MKELYEGLTLGMATRDAYGEALRELGAQHADVVVLDADLAKSTKSVFFADEFPDRFLNVGIQEANMVGMAGGLASTGLVPFISSFACFVILKGFDQLRMAVAYPGLNVKVVGSHGGITPGEDGASQQAIEDIALACSLPGFTVCVPSDEHQTRAAVRAAYAHKGPVYIRTGRPKAPFVYSSTPDDFAFGRASQVREGSDVTVIANGMLVGAAMVASDRLRGEGIGVRVLDMACVKPLDEEAVVRAAQETGAIVTAEEHLIHGGLGARVAQVVCRSHPVPMEFVGLDDTYAESGDAAALMVKYGLTAERIVAAIRSVVPRRREAPPRSDDQWRNQPITRRICMTPNATVTAEVRAPARPSLDEMGLSLGKRVRLQRLLYGRGVRNGTLMVLPIDQGIEHGPLNFFPNPASKDPDFQWRLALEGDYNAIALHWGLARFYMEKYAGKVPLILKINGKTNIPSDDQAFSPLTSTVEDAVAIGADAVGYTLYVGSPRQDDDIRQLLEVRNACDRWNMPLIVWSYPRGAAIEKKGGRDSLYAVDYAARLAHELGADVIKLNIPKKSDKDKDQPKPYDTLAWDYEEGVRRVVASAGRSLVLFSGGSKVGDQDLLEKAQLAMEAGATGLIFGRNMWQRPMDEALRVTERIKDILRRFPA